MYALKGFANHALFADNTPGVSSVIGELSNQSLTYSREIGQYVDDVAPDVTLVSFLSSADGTPRAIDPDFKSRTFAIVSWIYQRTLNNAGGQSATQFLEDILVAFQTKAQDFECGAIVGDGVHKIPEWVSWQDSVLGSENFVKIWFVDASFAIQYDEFEILVVPPLDNVDNFFQPGAKVQALLAARTFSQTIDLVQAAKGGFPETLVRAEAYDYHDPNDTGRVIPTNWTVLIYGIAGNNIDSIIDALQGYILSHSTHSRDEWKTVLPDIFKRTEFVLVPMEDQFAIPQRVVEAGIYSPFANNRRVLALLAEYAPDYPTAHVAAYAVSFGHPYKSVAIAAVGSNENRNNQYELVDVFPDWLAVSSTSNDFNRQSQDTQAWSELLEQMLIVAESMGPYTSLPAGMTRLNRDGKLFVVASYGNIHYLVAAKYNFPPAA